VGGLVGPQEGDEAPCILKGTIPSGVSIPIHSHDVVEIVFVLSGNIEVLVEASGKLHWVEASAGDLVEIPSNAKHAFRNRSQNPMLNLLFTTSKLRPTIDRYRPKKSAIQAMNASSTL
jgi:quercetin dioxygenase-like cupin family protein